MDLDGCFLTSRGCPYDRWVTKQELINSCLETAGVTPEEAVMVGDCLDDLESARKAGMDFVGVTYGYGFSEEDCVREGRPFARTPKELLDRVLGEPFDPKYYMEYLEKKYGEIYNI